MDVSVNLSCTLGVMIKTKKVKPGTIVILEINVHKIQIINDKIFICVVGEGADPNRSKSKNKKLLCMEKQLAKNPHFMITTLAFQQKSLEDLMSENDFVSTTGLNKLRVRMMLVIPFLYYIVL